MLTLLTFNNYYANITYNNYHEKLPLFTVICVNITTGVCVKLQVLI